MPALDRRGDVRILSLGDDENRFTTDWMSAVEVLIDEVERAEDARALVTIGGGKFFSNGLVVEALDPADPNRAAYLAQVEGLYARILALPMITVAAVQGHAFGAGAMLSLAHDFGVMRADRGFWCLPETDLGISFTPGMAALIQSRLDAHTANEAMLTSRRYDGPAACAARIVEATADGDGVLEAAATLAQAHAAKAGDTIRETKLRMRGDVIALLSGQAA